MSYFLKLFKIKICKKPSFIQNVTYDHSAFTCRLTLSVSLFLYSPLLYVKKVNPVGIIFTVYILFKLVSEKLPDENKKTTNKNITKTKQNKAKL